MFPFFNQERALTWKISRLICLRVWSGGTRTALLLPSHMMLPRRCAATVAHSSTASMSSASVFLAVVLCKTTPSQDSTQVCVYNAMLCCCFCNAETSVLQPCFLFNFLLSGELIGVEYLCSQQSWEFRENFGRDPDVPDGIPAGLGDVEDEGLGDEAEEQDHTISPLSLISTKEAICLSRDSPSPSQSSQEVTPEPQEDVCMHASILCHGITWRTFSSILTDILSPC